MAFATARASLSIARTSSREFNCPVSARSMVIAINDEISMKRISPAKNALTAISFAAFNTAGKLPPARAASRASNKLEIGRAHV